MAIYPVPPKVSKIWQDSKSAMEAALKNAWLGPADIQGLPESQDMAEEIDKLPKKKKASDESR